MHATFLNLLLKSWLFQLCILFSLPFIIYIAVLLFVFFFVYYYNIIPVIFAPAFGRSGRLSPQKVTTVGFEGSHPFRCFSFAANRSGSLYKGLEPIDFPLCFNCFGGKKKKNKRVHQRYHPCVRKLSRHPTYSLLPSSRSFSLWVFGSRVWHPSFLLLSFWFPPFVFVVFFLWAVWRVFASVLGPIGRSSEVRSILGYFPAI